MTTPDHPGRLLLGRARCEPVSGVWATVDSVALLRLLLDSGYDYVGIDCQHSALSEADAARLLSQLGPRKTPVLVRVSSNRPELLGRLADAGADGIIVPLVDDAAMARAAVSALHYPPLGERSYGPWGPQGADWRANDDRVLCFVMIETRSGLAAVDEILGVDGVDGIYVGPADLGIALGLGPGQFPPTAAMTQTLGDLARSARRAGVVAGVHAGSGGSGAVLARLGFTMLTLAVDVGLVRSGAIADQQAFRAPERATAPDDGRGPYD